MNVDRIWWREVTADDLYALSHGGDRAAFSVPGVRSVLEFFDTPLPELADEISDIEVSAGVVGDPWNQSTITFHFDLRRGVMTVPMGAGRHPGWGILGGFPEIPPIASPGDGAVVLKHFGGIHLYLVRSTVGTYYAGVTVGGKNPEHWPAMVHPLFTGRGSGVIHLTDGSTVDLSPLAVKLLEALSRRKNVLLYGPPGTGKTYALSQVTEVLRRSAGSDTAVVGLQPDDALKPFTLVFGEPPTPGPVLLDWVTFHQEIGYEDFVVGLRPTGDGVRLAPYAGRFLDLAIQVHEAGRGSGVLVIDEINRGNVPRALGDFMTYLDDVYRLGPDGSSDHALPVHLPKIQRHVSGAPKTEPIWTMSGEPKSLPVPWFLPHNLYIIATMNSVDRAVAPIDSAIARRFERIDAPPDPDALMEHLGVSANISDIDGAWDARLAAVLLMIYLNEMIEEFMGPDMALGQSFFWNVHDWQSLQLAWDRDVWPQLRDRFASRPEQLAELLRVDDAHAPKRYPFTRRPGGSRTPDVRSMTSLDADSAAEAFKFLVKAS